MLLVKSCSIESSYLVSDVAGIHLGFREAMGLVILKIGNDRESWTFNPIHQLVVDALVLNSPWFKSTVTHFLCIMNVDGVRSISPVGPWGSFYIPGTYLEDRSWLGDLVCKANLVLLVLTMEKCGMTLWTFLTRRKDILGLLKWIASCGHLFSIPGIMALRYLAYEK